MSREERYAEANARYKKSWSDDDYHRIRKRFNEATQRLLNEPTSVAAVALYVSAKAAYDERERHIAALLAEREAIYAEMQK